MYTVNPLMRNTLITFEEVMFHAPTKHTVDRRMIDSSIIVAEERFIRNELGSDFYDQLVNSKNTVVTSGNLATLQIKVNENVDPENAIVLKEGDIVNAFEQMSASNQTLWKQHLWKIVAECLMVSALPEGFIQFSSEGAFHSVPPAGLMVTSGLVTPLTSSVKWQMDKKIQERVGPLFNSLNLFLCKNKETYPLYKGICADCNDNTRNTKWSGICTNLYDDDDDVTCCE